MKKALYGWIFRALGWNISGDMDPEILKSVVVVIPHTSWHDFYIGLLARGIIGLEIHFVAKRELFKFPFGWYFRFMGGAPIDRSVSKNTVDQIAELFLKRKIFRLAIAPEGTRRKVDSLKSGFYYIALQADVPIIPVAFDYGSRCVRIFPAYYPSGDYNSDLKLILENYLDVLGKHPTKGFDAKNAYIKQP